MINPGTEYLLLQIVECWNAHAVNEENQALSMVLKCSHVMYKYYYCLGFFQIENN